MYRYRRTWIEGIRHSWVVKNCVLVGVSVATLPVHWTDVRPGYVVDTPLFPPEPPGSLASLWVWIPVAPFSLSVFQKVDPGRTSLRDLCLLQSRAFEYPSYSPSLSEFLFRQTFTQLQTLAHLAPPSRSCHLTLWGWAKLEP